MIKQTQPRVYLNDIGAPLGEHPCIIPHEYPIARAIVLYYHNQSHVGVELTLSLVRQTFLITKGRSAICLHHSVLCNLSEVVQENIYHQSVCNSAAVYKCWKDTIDQQWNDVGVFYLHGH